MKIKQTIELDGAVFSVIEEEIDNKSVGHFWSCIHSLAKGYPKTFQDALNFVTREWPKGTRCMYVGDTWPDMYGTIGITTSEPVDNGSGDKIVTVVFHGRTTSHTVYLSSIRKA